MLDDFRIVIDMLSKPSALRLVNNFSDRGVDFIDDMSRSLLSSKFYPSKRQIAWACRLYVAFIDDSRDSLGVALLDEIGEPLR